MVGHPAVVENTSELAPFHPCHVNPCFSVRKGAAVTGDDGSEVFVQGLLQFFAIDTHVGLGAMSQVLCLFYV